MAANGGSVIFEFEGNDSKLKNSVNSLGKGISTAFKVGTAAVGAMSTALGGLIVSATKSYADLEQNIGGIETLFKDSSKTVIENSKKAYETAGMSANQYMETVTSFSARLLQGLGGDTKRAASIADMAVIDMADNANKMGTAIESIQYAYQGFAKQNYTMLDNLKLGYGGTQAEMARLINDSGVLGDTMEVTAETVNNVSFDKMIEAIHVIQDRMGITGTTSKEAATTITGSVNSMKAAFDNFLNGSGSPDALSDSIVTAMTNIGNVVIELAPNIIDGLTQIMDNLLEELPGAMDKLVPALVQGIVQLTTALSTALPQLSQAFISLILALIRSLAPQLPIIVQNLITGLIEIINQLAAALPEMLPLIVNAILGIIPILIDNLPLFIEAGMNLLIALLLGLIEAIPQLLAYIPQIISSLVKAFLKLPPKLADVAIKAIVSLAEGLINNASKVINKAKEVATKVINGIKNNLSPSKIKKIGKDLITGLWNGITSKVSWVISKIKGLGNSILDAIKGVFDTNSPSKKFMWIGEMNMLGLSEGMENMRSKLNSTIANMVNLSPTMLQSANNSYSPKINVINQVSFEQDPLGQMVQKRKTLSSGAKNDYNFGMGV